MKPLPNTNRCHNKCHSTNAFSFIELQITMVILAISILNFACLYRVYSLQTSCIEKNTQPVSTYYISSQTNRWMRQLGTPANLEQIAGVIPWTPPVTGDEKYKIRLNSLSKNFEQSQVMAEVTMENK
jgi:hypothetical protein